MVPGGGGWAGARAVSWRSGELAGGRVSWLVGGRLGGGRRKNFGENFEKNEGKIMTRPTVVIIEMDEERARKECLALNLKAIGANRELAQWLLDNPRWPATLEAHQPRAADRPRAAGPLDYLRSGELNCRKSSLPSISKPGRKRSGSTCSDDSNCSAGTLAGWRSRHRITADRRVCDDRGCQMRPIWQQRGESLEAFEKRVKAAADAARACPNLVN